MRLISVRLWFLILVLLVYPKQVFAAHPPAPLPKPFSVNGLQFNISDWKATVPLDPKIISEGAVPVGPLILRRVVPYAVGTSSVETSSVDINILNLALRSFVNEAWRAAGGPPNNNLSADEFTDYSIRFENKTNTKSILSFRFIIDKNSRFSPHAEEKFENFNWAINLNRLLKPGDIFIANRDWCPFLFKRTLIALAYRSSGRLPLEGDSANKDAELIGIKAIVCHSSSWIIRPQGLEIDFGVDQVGVFTDGEPMVFVPWSNLAPILNIKFKVN